MQIYCKTQSRFDCHVHEICSTKRGLEDRLLSRLHMVDVSNLNCATVAFRIFHLRVRGFQTADYKIVVLFFQSLFVGFLIVCSNDHVFNPFSSFNFYLLNNRFLIIYIVKMSHYFITRQFKSVTQENC